MTRGPLTVVALDPGGRYAGLVLVHQPAAGRPARLVRAAVLTRHRPAHADRFGRWMTAPVDLAGWLARQLDAVDQAAGVTVLEQLPPPIVAVEAVTPPAGAPGIISLAGLLATTATVGAILGRWPAAVLVPPAGHGSGPPSAYPPLLRPKAARLGGPSTHARSAWDIATTALARARFAT